MKKTKAKPVKGSARTKKFDAGGLAALAGLGTLAYLLSRKKKDEEGKGKFEDLEAVGGAGRRARTIEEQIGRTAEPAADEKMASQEFPLTAPEKKPAPAPAPKRRVASQTFPISSGAKDKTEAKDKTAERSVSQAFPVSPSAGKSNAELPSKPYPKGVKPKDPNISTSGIGPKLTYGTPSQLDAAQAAMRRYREEQKKRQKGVPDIQYDELGNPIMKRGGAVKKYAKGGSVSSASSRADGIAQRGKTRGRMV